MHALFPVKQAALDHLVQRTDIDTKRILVFGRSLGGAVGAVLTKNNPDKVMLQVSTSLKSELGRLRTIYLQYLSCFLFYFPLFYHYDHLFAFPFFYFSALFHQFQCNLYEMLLGRYNFSMFFFLTGYNFSMLLMHHLPFLIAFTHHLSVCCC